MNINVIGAVIVCTTLLTSCAGSPIHNSFIAPGKINEAMTKWKGKNIDDAINRYGPPSQMSEVLGTNYYAWGDGNGSSSCQWWFKTNSANLIVKSGWRGMARVCYVYITDE